MSFIVKNRSRIGTNPGYYFSGSQVETTGSTFEYCRIIQNTMLQMSSSVSGGWNLWFTHDPNDFDIIGANYNRTFMSRGDETLTSSLGSEYNGDFRSYINIRRNSDTFLQIYRSKYVRNTDGVAIGEWWSWYGAINATASFDWWAFGNEYEYHFITATPSMTAPNVAWRYAGWGNPYPNHLPDDHRGIAFAPAGITSGSNILITLDRNMDDPTLPNGSFKPGYPIYISGFAPGGSSAVAPVTADLTRVVSITGNQLVVEFLKQNYDCPVVIGHRPIGTSVWGNGTPLNMAGDFIGSLDGSGSAANAISTFNQRSLANNSSRFLIVGPDNQYFHHTNIPQSYQGSTNTPLGTSRIIRYVAHPNPRPTSSQSVLYDEINDLYYICLGITGSDGGSNTNWNWPFFQYSGSLEGKTVISGVFDEQFITHTKPINLNPPPIPATSSWFFSNGYGGSYENWSRNTLKDPVVFGIDFEVTNCLPCFEDIVQRQNLIYEENYNNSLMKSNIYQFAVPTSSAIQADGAPCIVPQAPFIYGIPSARAVLGRQKYRSPGTAIAPADLPGRAQELTASC